MGLALLPGVAQDGGVTQRISVSREESDFCAVSPGSLSLTPVRMEGDTLGTCPRQSGRKGHLPLEDPLEMKAAGSEGPMGMGGGSRLHRGSSKDTFNHQNL